MEKEESAQQRKPPGPESLFLLGEAFSQITGIDLQFDTKIKICNHIN